MGWVELCSLKRYVLVSESGNMTLLGNRVFADVTGLR